MDYAENARLYPGEALEIVEGFPTIKHYQPATTNSIDSKPLIVCIPGAAHLARIFYGGHHESLSDDFIAYWLSQLGYGVLSVSYPLEMNSSLMPSTGHSFRIRDWGRQAAVCAQKTIVENFLPSRSIILLSWSMGGRMVVQFNIACKELGLHVEQYISLAATPGISNIRPPQSDMECTPSGYVSISSRIGAFCKQLNTVDLANGGREIIPQGIYLKEYVGGTPINLIGARLKFDGKSAFIPDELAHEDDSRVFDIVNTPFISALYPTSVQDAGHALTDKSTWGFLMTYKLESMVPKQALRDLEGTQAWEKISKLIHEAPSRMSHAVPGNHFFFVGKQGAEETAQKVVSLLHERIALESELASLLDSGKAVR
ncbi:hypothetical protein N7532_000933 [Penicillium argentinense]|uniref:Uncharacterized protein n=1 Tax=Penicillium argentinense TaxID=1131581 RepID=A0A9W9KLZ2_9EURO|nr:uncharacterized protein N7532_000933 [Penicillium argentinense]KAJ5110398.1 hypothetical protein N7532_000933 [Penicillium argentinense]